MLEYIFKLAATTSKHTRCFSQDIRYSGSSHCMMLFVQFCCAHPSNRLENIVENTSFLFWTSQCMPNIRSNRINNENICLYNGHKTFNVCEVSLTTSRWREVYRLGASEGDETSEKSRILPHSVCICLLFNLIANSISLIAMYYLNFYVRPMFQSLLFKSKQ